MLFPFLAGEEFGIREKLISLQGLFGVHITLGRPLENISFQKKQTVLTMRYRR